MKTRIQLCPNFDNDDIPESCLRYDVVTDTDEIIVTDFPLIHAERLSTEINSHDFDTKRAREFSRHYRQQYATALEEFAVRSKQAAQEADLRNMNRIAFQNFRSRYRAGY